MKKIIAIILVVMLSVVLLTPAYAIGPVGSALLSKVAVSGVSQSSTNPDAAIRVTVMLRNYNPIPLKEVMVSVNGSSSDTLSLTNSFGPFSTDFDVYGFGSVSFDLLASPNISGGNYPLSLTLTYVDIDGNVASVNRDISILIDSTSVATTTPIVVVESYSISKDKVNAGDQFELNFTLLNTSPSLALTNMLASFSSESSALTPIAGASNQLYIGNIDAGGSYTVKTNLMASSALPSGTYTLNIGLQYQDADNNTYNSEAAISIPVKGTKTIVEVASPQVVVSSYDIGVDHIFGGDEFEMTFVLDNISSSAANNVLFSYASEYNAFNAVSGVPNQLYIGKIAAGSSYTGKIKLKANDALINGIYNLQINLQYQGVDIITNSNSDNNANNTISNNTFSSTASISIQLEQTQKLNINSISISDTCVLGSKTLLSVNYENPGSSDIKNLVANLSGDILKAEKTVQIGTVKAGNSGFMEQSVTPQSAGQQKIDVSFTFEDSAGNSYTIPAKAVTVDVLANDAAAAPSVNGNPAGATDNGSQTDAPQAVNLNSYWIYFVIAGVVLVAAAAGIVWRVLYVKKKKTPKWSESVK